MYSNSLTIARILSFFIFLIISLYSSGAVAKKTFGPIVLSGFAKIESAYGSHQCSDCFVHPTENRQRKWADEVKSGAQPKAGGSPSLSLIHPYIANKPLSLGGGFKISALVSQRWRDGVIDIPGVWYDRNITIRHDYYGLLQIGQFPTRGWGLADYPHGALVGLSDAWGASGSGYGLLTRAIRYAPDSLDLYEGDLRLEYTYDLGDASYSEKPPVFHELYIQYVRQGFVLDLVYQNATNGLPSAWTHGPFRGIVNEAKDEKEAVAKGLKSNQQTLLLLQARYPLTVQTTLFSGIKRNYWSGAHAVIVGQHANGDYLWNDMFNVNWDDANDPGNPGYAAVSYDAMIGVRKDNGIWSYNYGAMHLGEAETNNPSERGQSNSALIQNIGAGYKPRYDVSIYTGITHIRYKHKGLAPLSMPSHSAFTGVDSRITDSGFAVSAGIEYVL